ncbi:MAG TPA: hypothetical protein VFY21_15230 [Xanthobacteraceae bacterium]|nr:hypothetical protein [Xanthobacteraceae bacterium]
MRKKPVRRLKPHETGLALVFAGLIVGSCATVEAPLGPIGDSKGAGATVRATQQGQPSDIECPGVTIRSGASAWQLPSGGKATDVRYQGSLGQLVRECAILGETMTMRVGVEGRLLVGPKGGPGNVKVPIRMALVAEGPQPKPLWSKFYNVEVSVPEGASQAVFSIVEDDLTFPMPANREIGNYIVYVGFDPQGAAAASRPAPKAKPKPRPAPQAAKPAAPPPPAKPASPPPAKSQPQFEPPPAPPPGVFAPPPGHTK